LNIFLAGISESFLKAVTLQQGDQMSF
jgi:hypothetical protein